MYGLRIALAAAVLCSLTACSSSEGPGDEDVGSTSEALTDVCPPANPALGIDIASFQHPGGAAINWASVATNRKFVIVKATEGSTYANTYYTGDVNSARAAGLIVGAYAVVAPQSKTGQTGAQQAAYFLAHSQHKPGDLPPLLDVEPFAEYGSVLPEAATVLSWLTAVETALGRTPMVYIRPDLIADLGTPAALGKYFINVPNYSTCPGYPSGYPLKNLVMWQYTSSAAIPGITGSVDGIRFYGDLTALKAFANDGSALPDASGYLDKVACDEIAGWDYDPNAKTKSTTVQISYNAALNATGSTAVSYPAANDRADLMTPIGSTNHGFSVLPPRSLLDGKAHSVDAYAVALETGVTGDRLTSPERTLNCPAAAIAAGAVKRWITTKDIFTAWKMNTFTDIAPETDAAVDAVTKGADITAAPDCMIADDGTPDVWVIDQGKRRHVVNPAALTAWRLTATKTPAAMVNGYPQGPNWPATPELVKGTAAEVYMLDVDINAPITATPDDPTGSATGTTPDAAPLDAAPDGSGGCSTTRARSADLAWLVALGVVVGALSRRRRRVAAAAAAVAMSAPAVANATVTHHLYFDGKSGTAGVKVVDATANVDRADLKAAVGSTNHGFVVATPYALFDGKVHDVFPYAIDTKGGSNPLLGDKMLTCAAAPPAAAVKRHITSPAVLTAWGFSAFVDEMPLTDAVIDTFRPGIDIAVAPVLVRSDDKSPEVWLVDGSMRRHVVDPPSAAAWHFDLTKVVTKPAADVNALTKGPDLAARPLLTRATNGAVYVLDDPASVPLGAVVNPDGSVTDPSAPGATATDAAATPGDDAGGCAVGTRHRGLAGGAIFAALVASVIAGLRRRRRS